MLLPRVGTFADGSWLGVLSRPRTGHAVGAWVRVVEYQVTVAATSAAGVITTRTELFRLITTGTDPQLATADELAACHQQRRESETKYKALKTHQRGLRQVLRSHEPDGVSQELYAYPITYQALRRDRLPRGARLVGHLDRGRAGLRRRAVVVAPAAA